MRQEIKEEIEIPSGITCEMVGNAIKCKKDSNEILRKVDISSIIAKVEGNKIKFHCTKANKNQYKAMQSYLRHLKNIFEGLNKKFIYKLQAANVHFPMTLKVVGSNLEITNFLGEKLVRKAVIMPQVTVEVKGQEITVSSHNKEAAGHTAANIEKATKVRNRDRRIFQDGIYLVSRPGGNQ